MDESAIAEKLLFVENISVTYDVDSFVISQVEETSAASSAYSVLQTPLSKQIPFETPYYETWRMKPFWYREHMELRILLF